MKRKIRLKPWDLVKVEWIDSAGASQHWTYIEDLQTDPFACVSVGWVVHEDDDVLVIAGTKVNDQAQVNGCMNIPVVAIRRITRLEPAQKGKP